MKSEKNAKFCRHDWLISVKEVGMRRFLWLMLIGIGSVSFTAMSDVVRTYPSSAMRKEVTVENWDKGGEMSHWVYLHPSEVFPAGVVRREGAVLDLPEALRPEIGNLVLKQEDGSSRTLQQLIISGAVDGCIVLHEGKVVFEQYPTMNSNDFHLLFSVSKAFVSTALAILEDQGQLDPQKPVESYLPQLKTSAWAGTRLRDIADMASGMDGAETGNDAYRNPAHKQFQLEATLGWQPRTASNLPAAARQGDLPGFLGTIKRVRKPGETWAYTSNNTAVLGEVIERTTGKSLTKVISELIWSKIGAEHDALLLQNERGYPVAHAGMVTTLRDLARFGLLFTKSAGPAQRGIISEKILHRIFNEGRPELLAKDHPPGMLPLTYQWDMLSDKGEMAKGGWAGQLLYVNRGKDVVVAYFGTNLTSEPKLEALPCRIIAKTFF
jgi:CubicO group peptidase (beta-lactamase class C family)